MLSKICHYVPSTELKSIYYAIFSSHMMYGVVIVVIVVIHIPNLEALLQATT